MDRKISRDILTSAFFLRMTKMFIGLQVSLLLIGTLSHGQTHSNPLRQPMFKDQLEVDGPCLDEVKLDVRE